MSINKTIFLAILLLCSLAAKSQTCCTGGIPILDAFITPSVQANEFGLHGYYNFNSNNDLISQDRKLSDSHLSREISAFVIQGDYGISDAFSVSVSMPYLVQSERIETSFDVNEYSTQGIGDLSVWLTYSKKFSKWNFSSSMSLKFPTGNTNQKGENGIPLPLSFQLGSGSWDIAGILRSSYYLDPQNKFSIEGQTSLRLNSKGQDFDAHPNYRFGHQVNSFLGAGYHFLLGTVVTDIFSGFAYQYRMKDQFDGGFENSNTGGHWINFNLGTNLFFTPKFYANVAAGLPIYRKLNGLQLSTTWQGNVSIHLII